MIPGSADIYTDFASFENLRTQARQDAPGVREAAASQMEAMFVSLMLKSMREAGAALGDDSGAGLQRDLYDSQLALHVANGGRLGFADSVLRAVDGPGASAPAAATQQAFPAPPRNMHLPARDWIAIRESAGRTGPAAPGEAPGASSSSASFAQPESVVLDSSSPEAFVRSLWPAAESAARSLGTAPEAVVAVAALETGWGRRMPLRADGSTSNNLFGIKAHGWKGDVTRSATLEFESGAFQRRVEPFRAYDSPAAAVADFANFIRANPRYGDALNTDGDPVRFVHALKAAGYATDPRYGDKLEALVTSDAMKRGAASA